MNTVNIYRYIDPLSYLKDSLQEKQTRNAKFSLRSWARDLGINEATILSQILNGKRAIPLHYISKFTKGLRLKNKEAEYLEAIIEAHEAKTSGQKVLWSRKAQKISFEASYQAQKLEDFRLFENPLHMIILSLIQIKGFKEDPKWIQSNLFQKYSLLKIKESLDLLYSQGLIIKNEAGHVSRTSAHVSSTHGVASLWIKKFHDQSLKEAAEAIYAQSLDDREYASYVFCMKTTDLPEIKNKIRDFTTELLAQYTAGTGEGDSVYQMNLNLFLRSQKQDI